MPQCPGPERDRSVTAYSHRTCQASFAEGGHAGTGTKAEQHNVLQQRRREQLHSNVIETPTGQVFNSWSYLDIQMAAEQRAVH
eukprot:1158485-Pelagomonas_calceolata.AAC.15